MRGERCSSSGNPATDVATAVPVVQLEEVPEQNERRPHSSLASELALSSLLMTTMGDEEEEAIALRLFKNWIKVEWSSFLQELIQHRSESPTFLFFVRRRYFQVFFNFFDMQRFKNKKIGD